VLTVFSIPQSNQSEKKFCPDYWLIRTVGDIQSRNDSVIQNNPKARADPEALAQLTQLDAYKGSLVGFVIR